MVTWNEKELAAWKPQPPMDVAQWARKKIRLTKKMGASKPGPYDPDLTPWVHDIFEAWKDPFVEQIVFLKSAQIGGSLTAQILIDWTIDCDPSNILYFMDTDTNARWASVFRVQAMIDSNPELAKKVEAEHKRNVLEIKYDGGVLNLAGANSVSQLSSKSAPRVIRDETGKWKESLGAEAGALELAGERVEGQYEGFSWIFDLSTPVQEGDPILKQYESSDKGRPCLPCPFCGHYQELVWTQMKWPKDPETGKSVLPAEARENTWYECVNCAGKIVDHQKKWMLKYYHRVCDGDVITEVKDGSAEMPGDTRRIGVRDAWSVTLSGGKVKHYVYKHNCPRSRFVGVFVHRLYSVFRSWGSLVERWLKIGNDLSKRQTFVNAVLAQPWRQRTLKADESEIQKHIWAGVGSGIVPEGYEYITAGADIMEKYLAYTIWAWRDDGARHLVEYGELADIYDMEQITSASYELADKRRLGVGALFVDSRYRLTEVEDFCKKFANAFCCKGSSVNTVPRTGPVSLGHVKTDSRNKRLPQHLWRAYVNVHTGSFKEELHVSLESSWDFSGEAAPERFVSLHGDTDMDFILQLTAEERVEKIDIRGRTTHEWKQKRKDNHYLDCSVYAAAAFRYFYGEWSRGRAEMEVREQQKRQTEAGAKRSAERRDPWVPRGVKL